MEESVLYTSDVVLKTGLGHKTIFEVLALAKAVLILDGLKYLKNYGLKTKKVQDIFKTKRSKNPNFGRSQISDLKILILDEAKLD